jgi:surface polysaccharide O-acyltransferase-like enzyme
MSQDLSAPAARPEMPAPSSAVGPSAAPAVTSAPKTTTNRSVAKPTHPTGAQPTTPQPRSAQPTSLKPTSLQPTSAPSKWAQTTSAKLAYTSYLRVAAIIAVVLIHTGGLTYRNDEIRYTSTWWFAALVTFSTKWAVPTFVMVSGALLLRPPVNRSARLFYRRRLSRIGIPLVVWHIVYITLSATILVTTLRPQNLLARFLRGQSYTGLYFFWLILGLYLITPLLWPLVASLSRRALGVVGGLLVAVVALNQSVLNLIDQLEGGTSQGGDVTLFTQFVPYVGFFLLGYALRDFVVRGWRVILSLALLTTALCLELTWQVTGPFVFGIENAKRLDTLTPVDYQGWFLGVAAVAVFILVHSVVHPGSRWARPRAARLARRAGDLTLGVYATHLAVLMVLQRIPGHQWPSGAKTLPQLVALSAATLLGALALTLVIKRVPVLRRSV